MTSFTKKDGGPAFPVSYATPNGAQFYEDNPGMTLRDWFAGMALSGIIERQSHYGHANSVEAYKIADAMIAEREK